MWGKNREHKEVWLTDLKHCLWKSTGMVGPDPASPQAAHAGGAYSTKNDDEEVRHMMKEVSLRDRRPSDPQQRQYDQPRGAQQGGGGRGAGGSPARQQQPPQQQQQRVDYGDDEYEQYSDDGEPEGDEHWSDTGAKGYVPHNALFTQSGASSTFTLTSAHTVIPSSHSMTISRWRQRRGSSTTIPTRSRESPAIRPNRSHLVGSPPLCSSATYLYSRVRLSGT